MLAALRLLLGRREDTGGGIVEDVAAAGSAPGSGANTAAGSPRSGDDDLPSGDDAECAGDSHPPAFATIDAALAERAGVRPSESARAFREAVAKLPAELQERLTLRDQPPNATALAIAEAFNLGRLSTRWSRYAPSRAAVPPAL